MSKVDNEVKQLRSTIMDRFEGIELDMDRKSRVEDMR